MKNQFCKLTIFSVLALLILGCAAPTTKQVGLDPELIRQEEEKQKQLALEKDRDYDARLQRVALPILRAGVPLCEGNTLPRIGIQMSNIDVYQKDYQSAANAVFGLDDRVQIIGVTAGGPAEAAGVEIGDIILRVNGDKLPTGKKAIKESTKIADNALAAGSVVSFDLLRASEELSIDVPGEEVCRFSVQLLAMDDLNAFADGNAIYVTRGMMRFAENDRQLAVVVAHELAHNSQEHIKAKKKNFWLGTIFDVVAAAYGVNTQGAFGNMAARTYSKEFESEADYVGLYVMALADIDLSEAADFWRGFGAENPSSITRNYASSHPSSAERYLAIENTVIEIHVKQKDGFELKPEMKK